jgi:hypothetical protein
MTLPETRRELFALIRFYERCKKDWRMAAEYTLFKANGGDVNDLYIPWWRQRHRRARGGRT